MQVVEPGSRQGGGQATFTAKEQIGYVKEYIEQEGLAIQSSWRSIGRLLCSTFEGMSS
jgi:hypothetical protein